MGRLTLAQRLNTGQSRWGPHQVQAGGTGRPGIHLQPVWGGKMKPSTGYPGKYLITRALTETQRSVQQSFPALMETLGALTIGTSRPGVIAGAGAFGSVLGGEFAGARTQHFNPAEVEIGSIRVQSEDPTKFRRILFLMGLQNNIPNVINQLRDRVRLAAAAMMEAWATASIAKAIKDRPPRTAVKFHSEESRPDDKIETAYRFIPATADRNDDGWTSYIQFVSIKWRAQEFGLSGKGFRAAVFQGRDIGIRERGARGGRSNYSRIFGGLGRK